MCDYAGICVSVAQLIEHNRVNLEKCGSNPGWGIDNSSHKNLAIIIYEQSSFSNLSVTSTNITAHSPNASVASPTSQLILQPFHCFTYVTAHSPTLFSLLLRHKLFTYVTWRGAHEKDRVQSETCVRSKISTMKYIFSKCSLPLLLLLFIWKIFKIYLAKGHTW